MDDPTREEAFNQEVDARMEQAKTDNLFSDPWTPQKIQAIVSIEHGLNISDAWAKIWHQEYCDRVLAGEDLDRYDFILGLNLDVI